MLLLVIIAFVIVPSCSYSVTDEIEVYPGDAVLLSEALPGGGVEDVAGYVEQRRITALIQKQFRRDLEPIVEDIRRLPPERRAQFDARAEELAGRVDAMDPIPMEGFVAILPMTELEAEIFRLQAAVWRAQGKPEVRLWDQHRWDPLLPNDEPGAEASPASIDVAMMRNEYRADVFNVTSASERDLRLRLRITGLPGAPNPDWITVHSVEHVGTRWFDSVAAALPRVEPAGEWYPLDVPSGMTRQVWIAINRPAFDAGTREGAVEVRAATGFSAEVPFSLKFYPLRFPEQTSLRVGGWSDTDRERSYGITPQNRMQIIAHLREHFVNAPWATGNTLKGGHFGDDGTVTAPPDTQSFDDWVAMWPDAQMYMIFMNVGGEFDGEEMGTEAFRGKVGA